MLKIKTVEPVGLCDECQLRPCRINLLNLNHDLWLCVVCADEMGRGLFNAAQEVRKTRITKNLPSSN